MNSSETAIKFRPVADRFCRHIAQWQSAVLCWHEGNRARFQCITLITDPDQNGRRVGIEISYHVNVSNPKMLRKLRKVLQEATGDPITFAQAREELDALPNNPRGQWVHTQLLRLFAGHPAIRNSAEARVWNMHNFIDDATLPRGEDAPGLSPDPTLVRTQTEIPQNGVAAAMGTGWEYWAYLLTCLTPNDALAGQPHQIAELVQDLASDLIAICGESQPMEHVLALLIQVKDEAIRANLFWPGGE